MRAVVRAAILVVVAGLVEGGNQLEFQGVRANYSGEGRLVLGQLVGDYMYTLMIMGNTNAEAKAGGLTITPREKSTRNRVYINMIYSMAPLATIKVTMPPGREHACYVRSIYVHGDLGRIDISGGDLGASDMYDGQVVVEGVLGGVRVRGRSFNMGGSNEWWGGNIWADIWAKGPVKRIETYGGNMYYHPRLDMLGTIEIDGNLDKLNVRKYEDKKAGRMMGGALRGSIVVNNAVMKQLTVQGGMILGTSLDCLRLDKLTLTGQKGGTVQPGYREGMFKTYIVAADVGGDGGNSALKSVRVRDAVVHESIFGIKGDINSVKISKSSDTTEDAVSNVVMRAGYAGDLAKENKAPEINPGTVVTNVYGGNTVVVPFIVRSANTGDVLGVRLHFRDRAIGGFLSNEVGQTFSSSNTWLVTNYPVTGMFVWSTTVDNNGWSSNIVVRVHNHRTPYKYYDMYIAVNVSTATVPVTLVLTPPDNPRTFNRDTEPFLDWVLTVANPWQHGAIRYGLTGPAMVQLGLQVTNLDAQTGYVYTSKPLNTIPVGTYSNLLFSADNGTYRDEKNVTLMVVTGGTAMVGVEGEPPWKRMRKGEEVVVADRPAGGAEREMPLGWEGAFNRDIKNVSVVGDVRDSMFVAGTSDVPANDWAHADYFGRLSSVKITGTAESNTFVSVRRISFRKVFDYIKNFVWVDGQRQTGP